MHRLGSDPMPAGARQLKGQPGAMRIRVGDYRIVYAVHNDRLVVLVIRLGHRRDVYRAWALKRGRQG
jgi:mRNA interferase RelE/StbE